MRMLKVTIRRLLRRPGAPALAVFTLALGLAISTALFTITRDVVLRPFPFREQERLISIWSKVPDRGTPHLELTLAEYEAIRDRATSLEGAAASSAANFSVIMNLREPVNVSTNFVSRSFYSAPGRAFAAGSSLHRCRPRPESAAGGVDQPSSLDDALRGQPEGRRHRGRSRGDRVHDRRRATAGCVSARRRSDPAAGAVLRHRGGRPTQHRSGGNRSLASRRLLSLRRRPSSTPSEPRWPASVPITTKESTSTSSRWSMRFSARRARRWLRCSRWRCSFWGSRCSMPRASSSLGPSPGSASWPSAWRWARVVRRC